MIRVRYPSPQTRAKASVTYEYELYLGDLIPQKWSDIRLSFPRLSGVCMPQAVSSPGPHVLQQSLADDGAPRGVWEHKGLLADRAASLPFLASAMVLLQDQSHPTTN